MNRQTALDIVQAGERPIDATGIAWVPSGFARKIITGLCEEAEVAAERAYHEGRDETGVTLTATEAARVAGWLRWIDAIDYDHVTASDRALADRLDSVAGGDA